MNPSHYADLQRSSTFTETPVVFVIDADAAVRESLQLLIRSAGWQPRTFASAEEFLDQPSPTAPACLLTEMSLPGLSGLELQKLIVERTDMPVIFLSSQADVRATVQAMKAGAFEFMMKPFVGDSLLHTIRHALERSRAALRHQAEIRRLQQRYGALSRREREVMDLVLTGRLNKQVGGELGISEITVKAHRGRMMRKMQATSFAELMNMVAALRRSTDTNASGAFA